MYNWMTKHCDPSLYEQIQIICSRVRELETDKPRIFWVHDTADDPEVQFLRREPWKVDLFDAIVFVSHWQQQQYSMFLGVPYEKGVVMQHAIEPFPVHDKPKDGKIRLIYASTPHRGLEVLLDAFEQLNDSRAVLEVFSSFDIYDRAEQNKEFQGLYDRAKFMKNVEYHPSVPNNVIREAMQRSHILAYPSIYPETSCITVIEAMSAGLLCLVPNLAALPETCANFAWMYNFINDKDQHAKVYSELLKGAIDQYWNDSLQNILKTQKAYFDVFYSWDQRAHKWNQLMESVLHKNSSN
jgi:glycosyltransferase involved in cell wall biosynthesis